MTALNETPPAAPAAKKKRHLKRQILIAALTVVVGIIIVANVSKGGGSTTANSPAAPAAAAPAAAAGIGTAVRDGKFEFVVQSVAHAVKTVGNQYAGATAQGEFILVAIKITNTSDQPQTFFGSNTKGFDNAGRQVAPSNAAAIYLPDSNSLITPINPGNSVVGTLIFDVSVGSTLTSIELHDSAFSGGVTVQL